MTLRVAVQMDPIQNINIAGDSSFALMLAAQSRGYEVYHYDVRSLAWDRGAITAHASPVTVQRVEGDHFEKGEARRIDLAKDIDIVLMRQDPPFDLGYISAALLLDRLKGETLVVNDPREVINAPEKMFVLDYARFMPPTLIARTLDDVKAFQRDIADEFPGGWWSSRSMAMAARRSSISVPTARTCRRCSRYSTRPGQNLTWSSPSFPRWRKATSGSCWSMAKWRGRSIVSRARASSAPTSRRVAMPRARR